MIGKGLSTTYYEQLKEAAEEQGEPIFDALMHEHRGSIQREQEKAEYAFAAWRKVIEKISLPQVRNYRLNLLKKELSEFKDQLEERAMVHPEMTPLLIIPIDGTVHE